MDKIDMVGGSTYQIEDYDTAQKKRAFLEMFVKLNGIVTATCNFVGIARSTYYLWRDTDQDFREKANIVLSDQPLIVEDLLLKAIAREEAWAIAFYLKAKHPAYNPKVQLQHSVEPPKTLEDLFDENAKLTESHVGESGSNRGLIEDQKQTGA